MIPMATITAVGLLLGAVLAALAAAQTLHHHRRYGDPMNHHMTTAESAELRRIRRDLEDRLDLLTDQPGPDGNTIPVEDRAVRVRAGDLRLMLAELTWLAGPAVPPRTLLSMPYRQDGDPT